MHVLLCLHFHVTAYFLYASVQSVYHEILILGCDFSRAEMIFILCFNVEVI